MAVATHRHLRSIKLAKTSILTPPITRILHFRTPCLWVLNRWRLRLIHSLNDTLRIKLSKTWWKNFSNQIETGTYWTTSFNQLIKGIYVTTATPLQLPGQGSLVNVNLFIPSSGIYFYYLIIPARELMQVCPFPDRK